MGNQCCTRLCRWTGGDRGDGGAPAALRTVRRISHFENVKTAPFIVDVGKNGASEERRPPFVQSVDVDEATAAAVSSTHSPPKQNFHFSDSDDPEDTGRCSGRALSVSRPSVAICQPPTQLMGQNTSNAVTPSAAVEKGGMSAGISPRNAETSIIALRRQSNAREVNRLIEESLKREQKSMERVVKLLLLGPSESGKSTVLKQMRIIHLNGFSVDELYIRRYVIFENIVQSIVQLLHGAQLFHVELSAQREADAELVKAVEAQTRVNGGFSEGILDQLSDDLCSAVKNLWADEKIQWVYENHRSDFHLIDCAKYFLDDLDRIYEPDYVPTVTDVLHARTESIGVTEIRYVYKKLEFRIFDVGGQKTERRKWIHIFDNVNSIFFIAAISEYDQQMCEDNATNRLHDAIELFRNIGNNKLFRNVQMILFLNKKDIFAEKITRVPLTVCFPKYKYKNDYKNAAAYITKKFEVQIRDKRKMIYTHLTCATDTDQVQFVTNSVTDMIIAENFKQTGLSMH